MIQLSDEHFGQVVNEALASLPGEHARAIKNVAITWQDEPSAEQRQQLQLRDDQTLFGLYEGLPLAQRQGQVRAVPDKITIFRQPLQSSANSTADLREQVRHTLWHEIGHYYGLDHTRIKELEN